MGKSMEVNMNSYYGFSIQGAFVLFCLWRKFLAEVVATWHIYLGVFHQRFHKVLKCGFTVAR